MSKQLGLFARNLPKGQAYPTTPGYAPCDTSYRAARDVSQTSAKLKRQILEILRRVPSTPDEVADEMGKSVLYIRPRFSELYESGKIEDTGARRRNASGKAAKVWKAKG